jgi:hypothetical protein
MKWSRNKTTAIRVEGDDASVKDLGFKGFDTAIEVKGKGFKAEKVRAEGPIKNLTVVQQFTIGLLITICGGLILHWVLSVI